MVLQKEYAALQPKRRGRIPSVATCWLHSVRQVTHCPEPQFPQRDVSCACCEVSRSGLSLELLSLTTYHNACCPGKAQLNTRSGLNT